MIYRKEIDGLRALAIIPVVFSHLGTNILSGGFIGVDIFFVISGYLITSIIYEDFKSGNVINYIISMLDMSNPKITTVDKYSYFFPRK